MVQFKRKILLAALATLTLGAVNPAALPVLAQDSSGDTLQQPKKLAAVNSLPYWSHDAMGYHPALCVRVENLSGQDLTGQLIKMQCRFMDLRQGHVMIDRKEQRYEFAPNQGVNLIFHGPEAYELPIDQYQWPLVECKLMSRVGNVDDSGTEDLLVQKLDSVTMTDEEAIGILSRGLFQHQRPANRHAARPPKDVRRSSPPPATPTADYQKPEQPLSAKALSLASGGKPGAQPVVDNRNSLMKFAGSPKLPGLGSEFLEFEQTFGQPMGASLKDRTWSWIHYAKQDPSIDVYVGAKGTGSKADIIVLKVPAELIPQESQAVTLAKSLSGKLRAQPLEHPHKSVKYQQLSEQQIRRIMVTTLDANGYKVTYLTPRGTSSEDNNYIIILSRFTGDTVAMIPDMIRRAPMMRFLGNALNLPDQD